MSWIPYTWFMPKPKRTFSLKPSTHDKRNYKHKKTTKAVGIIELPKSITHRAQLLRVYQQGSLGTCYANMGVELMEQRRYATNYPDWPLSRMFLSYVTRIVESNGNPKSSEMVTDNGATLLNTAKAMKEYGVCLEELYPYKDNLAYFRQIPSQDTCLTKGMDRPTCFGILKGNANASRIKEYVFMEDIQDIKESLAMGYNVGIGIDVYTNFMNYSEGVYRGQKNGDRKLGGHAVVIIGYDNFGGEEVFEFVNSWGDRFGYNGRFYCSADFVAQMIPKYDAFRVTMNFEATPNATTAVRKISRTRIKSRFGR